jgi:NAD(P)H-dependent flavin oxidoreductase YrpB (nitropropane dioxygenase family)
MLPIIQGGMGIGISNPHLAKVCSMAGILGTVSCTGAERVLVHLLQRGDVGGHYRRALSRFPFPEIVDRILAKYFVEGGIPSGQKFKEVPLFSLRARRDLIELAIAGSFALISLAKEGHNGLISVNYLEKLQIGHVYHLTGAMLAEVDYVTMGAGITLQIPGVLNALAQGGNPSYRVDITGGTPEQISFSPREFLGEKFPRELKRPGFLPIISTDALANVMKAKVEEPEKNIQAFVVELPTAGGHNAPPRKKGVFNDKGEPIYGEKDNVDWKRMREEFGIPFYIAGSHASPEHLAEAQALGAVGIQCGSIFALSEDSGMEPLYRAKMRYLGYRGELVIRTDPTASPTGYPFKVPQLSGTISEQAVYEARVRNCSRKALQFPCRKADGKIVFRCAAEPIEDYLRKGGKLEDTVGARCLCNGLFAATGLGDVGEVPIFTMGDDVSFLSHLMRDEHSSYGAIDAIAYLLS